MIERKVTLALIATLALQTGSGLVWAGAAAQRITELERKVLVYETSAERLARVEARLLGMSDQLARIEDKLDRD